MVGRILYLKNNHVPPFDVDLKCEYASFGNYDGISISENVFKNKNVDLLKIWVQSVDDTIEMNGGYSSQAMYLFSDADEDEDDKLWKNDSLPFLFLIAIQLNKRDENLNEVSKVIKTAVEDYCQENVISAQITSYLMMDENDILLAIKCNNYKLGMIVTNSLHKRNNGIIISGKTFHVSYSFTITGIAMSKNDLSQYGIPDHCQIQLVEREPGSIKEISEMIGQKGSVVEEQYTVFGRDDFLLRFNSNDWESILSLYKEKGPFYNDEDYRKRLLSISTRFLYKIEDTDTIKFGDGKTDKQKSDINGKGKICPRLRKKIEELYKKDKDALHNNPSDILLYNSTACFKAIWQILNSIEKFELRAFPDYIYISIFAPLSLLVSKIVEQKENRDYLNNIEEIYSFLTAINQISQNLIRAERQFMQAPELNANCYNIPIKLYSFYAAFVDKVKNYLNYNYGTTNLYEFTLYPGMNEQLKVRKVLYFPEDDKRLFLMKIPEKQIFDPKHMMICLCHEVGHFVGSNLRQRERRYESLKCAIARMICLHAYCNKEIKRFITKDGLQYLFEVMYSDLTRKIDEEKKKEENEPRCSQDMLMHSDYLKPVILHGINNYIDEMLNNTEIIYPHILVDFIDKHHQNSKPTIKNLQKYKLEYNYAIYSYLFDIQYNVNRNENNVSTQNMINRLYSILNESFADLVSVLILDLDFKSYCQAIFKSLSEYGIKDIDHSDIVIRVVLVAKAMIQPKKSKKDRKCSTEWNENDIYTWEDNEKDSNVKAFLEEVETYYHYAYYGYNMGIDDAYDRLKDLETKSVLTVFRDYELLYSMYNYLGDCRLYFEENSTTFSESFRSEIKKTFDIITEDEEISKKIIHINHVNNVYDNETRNRVQKNLML